MASSFPFPAHPLVQVEPTRRLSIVVRRLPWRLRPSAWMRLPPPVSSAAASWADSDGSLNDSVGGWFVHKIRSEQVKDAWPRFHLAGIGASAAILLAALTYFWSAKKGFKICFTAPFHSVHEKLIPAGPERYTANDSTSTTFEAHEDSAAKVEEEVKMKANSSEGGRKRVIFPVGADAIQQEALHVLKKLKIMESDADADELCARREYARWFVKTNYLERKPKHKILPKTLVARPVVTAFDDVSPDDSDFLFIQSLAEAGVVLSRLSALNSCSISDKGHPSEQEKFYFYPESVLSRFDLLNWKALLEYSFSSEFEEKMLRNQVKFSDISKDASSQLLLDLMAGENSITRKAFGNIRCLQPHKPVTKAQAAVVLASGRMADSIDSELSRLEAENISRLHEEEEIRSELIQRGDIQRLWGQKLAKEKSQLLEAENALKMALRDLDDEKAVQKVSIIEHVKEKAALDCQRQLLQNLKDEINVMHEKIAGDGDNLQSEQQNMVRCYADLRRKQDAIVETKLILEAEKEAIRIVSNLVKSTKSILEAEKEAVRIVRSWVEDEALQMQNRANILAQAASRWKYKDESVNFQACLANSSNSKIVLESNGKQPVS